jgi:hypothetical protein
MYSFLSNSSLQQSSIPFEEKKRGGSRTPLNERWGCAMTSYSNITKVDFSLRCRPLVFIIYARVTKSTASIALKT